MSNHKSNIEANRTLGIISIVVALQVLPISDIIAKYLALSLPVIQVIWGRFFFHCVATGAYTAYKHGPRYLLPTLSGILILRSASLFAAVGLFYITIHHLPLTTSLTLWFVEPFFLTLLAAILLKEKVSGKKWGAVVLGFVGIVVAIRPTIASWHWAYAVGLCAGFFYALFLFFTKRLKKDLPPVASVYQTGLVGGLIATALVTLNWTYPTEIQWGLLIACGTVAAIAHLFIIKSFEFASASTIAPFTYTEIIMGAVLGYLAFSDKPDVWLALGLLLVVLSGIVIARSE